MAFRRFGRRAASGAGYASITISARPAVEAVADAAEDALKIQRDPKSMATVFVVDGEQIDLSVSEEL